MYPNQESKKTDKLHSKKDFWLDHFKKWKESGLTQKSYYASQKISHAAFGYWRTRIKNQR